jgi:phosphoribosylamine-glycine ligase
MAFVYYSVKPHPADRVRFQVTKRAAGEHYQITRAGRIRVVVAYADSLEEAKTKADELARREAVC